MRESFSAALDQRHYVSASISPSRTSSVAASLHPLDNLKNGAEDRSQVCAKCQLTDIFIELPYPESNCFD